MSLRHDASPVDPNPSPESGVPTRRRRRRSSWLKRLRRRVGIRFKWTTALLVVLAFVAVVGVSASALIVDALNSVQSSLTSFQRVATSLGSRPGTELTLTDFNRVDSSVRDLAASLAAARGRLGFLEPLAPLNPSLDTTLTSIRAAEQLALAARDMLNGMQPTLFFLVAGSEDDSVVTQLSSGERLVELLSIGRGQFASADAHLANARSLLDRLDLSGVPASIILNFDDLTRYQQQLTEVNRVLIAAPDFLTTALGIDAERSYLVLSQNNDELRPSGGYISTYGWLSIRNGRVTGYNYSPTTDTSPNPPAATLAADFTVPDWWLRFRDPVRAAWDGSWSPDFPTTARMALWYYNGGGNPQSPVDGVIAIDVTGFEYLLGVLGSVTVPGYSQVVTTDNFREVVYDIRAFGEGEDPHKRFVASLYQQIFTDWQNLSFDEETNAALLGALLRALQEKHILLYFNDAPLNDAVTLLGWTGTQVPAVAHDYLLVADANLGNKSNHSILRGLTYDVDLQADGSVVARTTVAYDYPARIAESDPAVDPEYHGAIDYQNLLQVIVPAGATLTDNNLPRTPQTVVDETSTAFVSRVSVPFDTSERFQFSYTTPPLVEDFGAFNRYRLLVQKQAGTAADPLNVQIMLPQGARLVSASPQPAAQYTLERPILEFRFDLATDHSIELVYAR